MTDDRDYPQPAGWTGRVEPSPRRVRGYLGGELVFDTTRARYVWEWPPYPQYYVPVDDVNPALLVDEQEVTATEFGSAGRHGLSVNGETRTGAVLKYDGDAIEGVAGTVRIEFDALDSWFEEEEPIFVHPRNPYARIDVVRSQRHVQVALDGVALADSTSSLFLFETGLPTRYYLDRSDVAFEHLVASDTVTRCPYKGTTSGYWSVRIGGAVRDEHRDLAWTYDFPTRESLPLAGTIAFYNEKVDITLDGEPLERPATKFS